MSAWLETEPWTCPECGTVVYDGEPCHGCNPPEPEIEIVDPETVRRYAEIGEAA